MKIDFEGHRILLTDKIIYLTTMENNILEIIYNNKDKVTLYQDISNKIYQTECDELLKNLIRKHITLLRKKVSQYIKIKTVRDVGYIIEEETE